ncbi:hypothetical protein HDV04_004052 [Boothiomyces sp. JEL0838]|nr:hypothetical protein HDV04_004052 [Boothiomyces sp. JEL0838]
MSDLSSPFNNTDSPLAEKSKSQEDDLTKLSMDAHEIDTSKSLWMVDSFTPTKVLKTLSRKRNDIPIPDFSLGTRKTFVKEERIEIKNQIGGLVGEKEISFELDGEQPPDSLTGVISEDDDESEQSRSPSKQGSPSTFISTVSFKRDNNVSIQFGSTTIDDISEINGIPESLEDIAEEDEFEDENVFQSNKPSTPDGSFSHKLADMEETPKTPEQSEDNHESEQDDKIDSDNESVVFTSRADEQKALPDYNPSLNSVLRKSLTERRLQISPKSTPILSRKAQDNDGEKIEYPTVQDENEAINKFYEELSAKIATMEQDQTTQSLSPKERHYAALLILLNTIKKQEVIDNQTANSKL